MELLNKKTKKIIRVDEKEAKLLLTNKNWIATEVDEKAKRPVKKEEE